jgi:ParB family chromosome partitioning protein
MRHGAHFVDELAARHEAPVGKLVPLSAIRPNQGQPRSDFGELGDLVASIRDKGILEPLLVRRSAQAAANSEEVEESLSKGGGAPYLIVAGERRYRAALEVGLFEVPVIELQVNEEEAFEITLIENLQRKDLTPFEEAEGYRALASRFGYTQEQVAASVGRARSSVAESLALLEIPEELRRSAEALGIRAKSTLLEVARAGSPAAMKAMLEKAARLGLTRDDVRRASRESTASGKRGAKGRRRPYVFKFRAPDRRFALNLTFRQSTVDRDDLIAAIEQILTELRQAPK